MTRMTRTWRVPEDCRDYTLSLRRVMAREYGGVVADYHPLSFHPQGMAASYHSWTNEELDKYRLRTVVVELRYDTAPEDEYDEPAWRAWYGAGGTPKPFERKMSTNRFDLKT